MAVADVGAGIGLFTKLENSPSIVFSIESPNLHGRKRPMKRSITLADLHAALKELPATTTLMYFDCFALQFLYIRNLVLVTIRLSLPTTVIKLSGSAKPLSPTQDRMVRESIRPLSSLPLSIEMMRQMYAVRGALYYAPTTTLILTPCSAELLRPDMGVIEDTLCLLLDENQDFMSLNR
jgi:hypothetical protein